MTVESDLYDRLKGLVNNQVWPMDFPQAETLMTWPAIRYTVVSVTPAITVCGNGDDQDSDLRIQLDLVHVGPDQVRALQTQVLAAMRSFIPVAIYETSFELFDSDTKTYRMVMEYVIYQ